MFSHGQQQQPQYGGGGYGAPPPPQQGCQSNSLPYTSIHLFRLTLIMGMQTIRLSSRRWLMAVSSRTTPSNKCRSRRVLSLSLLSPSLPSTPPRNLADFLQSNDDAGLCPATAEEQRRRCGSRNRVLCLLGEFGKRFPSDKVMLRLTRAHETRPVPACAAAPKKHAATSSATCDRRHSTPAGTETRSPHTHHDPFNSEFMFSLSYTTPSSTSRRRLACPRNNTLA